jgi:carbamoyltransferase
MAEVILGVNSAYHESAASILVDGVLVASAEEERFSRIKHGKRATTSNADDLPLKAMECCLAAAARSLSDVTHVAYSFDPDRRWQGRLIGGTAGDFGTIEGEARFRASVKAATRQLKALMPAAEQVLVSHHEAHAYSASRCSPFPECGVLVVDGIGEDSSVWAGVDDGGSLRRVFTIPDPNSIGFLWEKVSEFLGFCRYEGPGKVMALAAEGQHGGDSMAFDEFVRCSSGGLLEIDDAVLQARAPGFDGLERVFGPRNLIVGTWARKANIAYGLQRVTERLILHLAEALFESVNRDRPTPIDALSLAGGVALNCVANHVLLNRGPWRRLWVQPAAHDAGTALGAALAVHSARHGRSARIEFKNAFIGAAISDHEAEAALRKWGLPLNRPLKMAQAIAELLAAGRTVAHVDGKAEFGPRALGNRSLLADPGRPGTKDTLNRQIKQREPFRPFAPSLLRGFAPEFCGAGRSPRPLGSEPYHFMTVALPVDSGVGHHFSAVTHRAADGSFTSRAHIVEMEDTARLRTILEEFGRQTGYPMLLNTSFNISEPIVNSADDACRTFCGSEIDALALGPYLVAKTQ